MSPLQQIGWRYHYDTERYDRSVCTGKSPRTGDAMPVDGWERGRITENANRCLAVALRDAAELHPAPSRDEVLQAIRQAAEVPYERLEQYFAPPADLRLL